MVNDTHYLAMDLISDRFASARYQVVASWMILRLKPPQYPRPITVALDLFARLDLPDTLGLIAGQILYSRRRKRCPSLPGHRHDDRRTITLILLRQISVDVAR